MKRMCMDLRLVPCADQGLKSSIVRTHRPNAVIPYCGILVSAIDPVRSQPEAFGLESPPYRLVQGGVDLIEAGPYALDNKI